MPRAPWASLLYYEAKPSLATLKGMQAIGEMESWRHGHTGTMHRAEAYDPKCGSMMLRTKLEGEESFED
jgi:hypothetical protein